MRPSLLGDLEIFRVIAAEGSFTRAAKRLGVTQSALSQTLKRLEEDIGIRLLARTTRSVSPTHAGARLLTKLSPALDEVTNEIKLLASQRDEPVGTVRVSAGKHAADTILWPALSSLIRQHPGIEIEVSVENDFVDLIAGRFDAGIRLGERLEKDMVALPIGPRMRVAVVAAPSYLSQHGTPKQPSDLSQHACISFRNRSGELSPWDFEKDGRSLTVKPGRGPIFNDSDLMVAAATEGYGFAYILEDIVSTQVASGALVRVLEEWCEPFAGYYLYYPSRRQQTSAFTHFKNALRDVVSLS